MGAIRARLRAELRVRWRSWVALALGIGFAGAVVLTAAVGARRTATAFPRFLDDNHAENVYIAAGRPSDPEMSGFWDEVERLPQVVAAGRVAAMILVPPDGRIEAAYHFAGVDSRYGDTVDRPNVVAGRRPDPERPDEVLINRAMATSRHLRVGSTVDWLALTPQQTEDPATVPGDGTPVHLRVVGIGVYPNEVVPTAPYDSVPFFYLTPAFFRAHSAQSQEYGFEVIRLRRGQADVAAFRAELDALLRKNGGSEHDIMFASRKDRNAQVQRAVQPQALALGVFAVLAGVAFLLLIGQVLARRFSLDSDEYPALRALGMSRNQLAATSMARVSIVAVGGAAVAVVAAALASPLMPVGPARLAEPHPGVAVNVAMLAAGFVATVVLVVGVAAIPAWRAASLAGSRLRTVGGLRRRRRTLALDAGVGAGLPATAVIGIRSTLQPGRGRTSVPVRGALVSTGLAIAALVAAVTFTGNLNRLVSTPRLYGWNWDLKAGSGFFPLDLPATKAKLQTDHNVEAVAGGNFGEVTIAGRTVPAIGVDPVQGSVFPTLLEGHAPRADDEIVLGTRTLRNVGRKVGDRVAVSISGSRRTMRIVGRAIFPKLGAGSFSPTNLGQGAAVRAPLFGNPEAPADTYSFVLIRLRAGTDVAAEQARLRRAFTDPAFCGGDPKCAARADPPGDISSYRRIRGTPLALAAALGVMAVGALGHVLVSSVRRRRRDLAVLKTLGFVRRQVAAVTAWQATTIAAVALVIGLPVGTGLGQLAWRLFAEQLGVGPESAAPVAALLLAIPVTLLLANLIATFPAMLAARTHPADVLHPE